MNFFTNIRKKVKGEWLLIAGILVISGISHGFNMFNYPYYEADEGTYMAQGWAVLSQGKLAPYTYWYDHAPVGWFLISLWTFLTGGLFTFGFSINSGRVLMLVIHLASSVCMYLITKKMTGSKLAGVLSVMFFSLTPLGIYFQRRVLLDNIMMFWVLLSFVFILYGKKRLKWIVASAVSFGIAVLSKESAIFFYPVFLYLLFLYSSTKNRLFGIFSWLTISGSLISLYFLFALLKGELFPTGTLLGGSNEHVSLFGTLDFQANRGKISILDKASSFWSMFETWKNEDFIFIMSGIIATIFALLAGIKDKAGRIIGLFALSYWAFILRGGLVLEFYVIPLIIVLALAISYTFWKMSDIMRRYLPRIVRYASVLPLLAAVAMLLHMVIITSQEVRGNWSIYFSDQTTAQRDAVDWVLSQKLPNQFYVIDMYAYLDLNLRNKGNFARADYYWKVDGDKEIKETILKNDPNNIDYIMFTPLIGGDLGTGELPMTGTALANSNPITSFDGEGWYVQMWAVKNKDRILTSAWETYKKKFITNGRVIDNKVENFTTSEAQSYAMLRAVWMNDKKTFDEVYTWSNDNLWQENGMYGWKWKNGRIDDKGFAPDADQDIALALLFAYNRWHEEKYLTDAKSLLQAIWDESVVEIKNKPYLIAGSWANKSSEIIINPSYFAPASYKIFADVDPKHDWRGLSTTTYEVLEKCTAARLDKPDGVLPPEWCAITKGSATAKQPSGNEPDSSDYGYNAFRVPWKVALDYQWNKDARAKSYLRTLSFLHDEWVDKKKLSAVYTHDGEVWEEYETAAIYGGNLAYFSVLHPEEAKKIYEEKILKKLYEDKEQSYWEDPENYYMQNWAWFGTALYTNNLPNLWTFTQTKKIVQTR